MLKSRTLKSLAALTVLRNGGIIGSASSVGFNVGGQGITFANPAFTCTFSGAAGSNLAFSAVKAQLEAASTGALTVENTDGFITYVETTPTATGVSISAASTARAMLGLGSGTLTGQRYYEKESRKGPRILEVMSDGSGNIQFIYDDATFNPLSVAPPTKSQAIALPSAGHTVLSPPACGIFVGVGGNLVVHEYGAAPGTYATYIAAASQYIVANIDEVRDTSTVTNLVCEQELPMRSFSFGLASLLTLARTASSPTDIDATSLAHRWRPSRAESCWSDNGVTPATAGGLLYRVDDEIGTDHLLQATALERPTWASNATPSKHSGIAFALGKSLLTAGNISTTDTTYYWVGAFNRISDSVAFSRTTGGTATEYVYYATASNGAAADTMTVTRGTTRTAAPSAGALPVDRLAVVALVVDAGSNASLYVDGVLVATNASSPGVGALASRLGLNIMTPGFSTSTGTCTCVELAMYSVAHDATAVAANSAILLAKYNTLAAAPSDLASLLLDLRLGAADLYQDAARTTAAVSGDPVGGWKDTAAAAHHLDQSTSARRPIYYDSGLGGGSRPRVSFDGVDDGLLMSGWGLGSGAQTIALEFVRRSNVPTAQRLFSTRVAGPIFSAISLINYAGYAEITCYLGGAGGNSIGCNPVLGTGRHTLVVCYDGSGSSTPANYAMFVDGVSQTVVSGNSFLDAVTMGALGSYTDASIPSAIDVGRIAAWSGDHRDSRLAIEGWLNG